MSFSGALQAMTRLSEFWEDREWEITRIQGEGRNSVEGGVLSTRLELRIPLCEAFARKSGGGMTLDGLSVGEEGGLTVNLVSETTLVPEELRRDGLTVTPDDARVEGDELVVTMSVTAPTAAEAAAEGNGLASEGAEGRWASGADSEETEVGEDDPEEAQVRDDSPAESTAQQGSSDAGTEDGDPDSEADPDEESGIERRRPDVPAFEDTEYLQEVYDTYETFAEMAGELDMDVTAETVRRYMIDVGVHEPTCYDTGLDATDSDPSEDEERVADERAESDHRAEDETDPDDQIPGPGDADDPSQVLLADGIGLPNGVSGEEFVEIVMDSKTLYEVQRQLDVEREEAQQLLSDHNLLDLVMGQLRMESQRNVTRETVIERLRESASA